MRLGTIQAVSPDGVLTIWSDDLRQLRYVAKWNDKLAGLVGSEVAFEEPSGREITTLRLTQPSLVYRVQLEPASPG